MKEMTTEEYQNFLDTITTLPEKEHKIIKRGVLQLNDDKKQLFDTINKLQEKVEYLKNKIENKDSWCQLIADIGYDYDGYRQTESLMSLIDELVKYALYSRDDYDYEEFMLEGGNNE